MLYDFYFLGKVFTLIIWINIAGKKVQILKRAFQEWDMLLLNKK